MSSANTKKGNPISLFSVGICRCMEDTICIKDAHIVILVFRPAPKKIQVHSNMRGYK
jgi:hypothetical protein